MPYQTPTVVRAIINAGHGLGNVHPSVFDEGASSPFGTEAYIVSRVADQVVDHFYFDHTETCGPRLPISVIPTPLCSIACATSHPRASHLSYIIDWINENKIHTQSAGYGDVVLSLHMNEAPSADVSGTLVIIDNGAPVERTYEALKIAEIVSGVLGIPNRGVTTDNRTPRRHLGIVEETEPPAFLIELGFVTHANDVRQVETCGAEAVIAVINRFAEGNR